MYKDLRKPAKLADQRLEHMLQQDCAQWLKKTLYNAGLPQVFYHVANERKATAAQHGRLKLQGVLKGVSDVVLPLKSGEYCGVYCELKTKTGSPSQDQKDFLTAVASEGYLAIIVNDIETFKEVFTYYIYERTNNKH